MKIRRTEWIVVLDNAKVHNSSIALKTMKILGFKIMFLPACPHKLLLNYSSEWYKVKLENLCIKKKYDLMKQRTKLRFIMQQLTKEFLGSEKCGLNQ